MKYNHIVYILLLSISVSCSEDKVSEKEVYEYLEICYEDYYLNYDVDVTNELDKFEKHLIEEGHLQDSTGKSYQELLEKLSKDIYFSPPLKFDEFNNKVLYKVPGDIKQCAASIFGIDSNLVATTSYYKAQKRIRQDLEREKEVSIGAVFKYNSEYLSPSIIRSPFVRQSTQQLLYKWYFKSKYDREIPIDDISKPAQSDTSSIQ